MKGNQECTNGDWTIKYYSDHSGRETFLTGLLYSIVQKGHKTNAKQVNGGRFRFETNWELGWNQFYMIFVKGLNCGL